MAILTSQLLSVFYWAVCSEGSGIVLSGLSSASKNDGCMQQGMERIHVSSKSSKTASRVWGLFFLHNMNSGREHLLRIPCSCNALRGTNKSSMWIIVSSSFPPGCSYSVWWFSCRNNECLSVAFLISHKAQWRLKWIGILSFLAFSQFGYPVLLTLVFWQELLVLMLAQSTHDSNFI